MFHVSDVAQTVGELRAECVETVARDAARESATAEKISSAASSTASLEMKLAPYWRAQTPWTHAQHAPLPAEADVVVIGAGIVGVAVAYWLARFGVAPLLLEAQEPAWGASGRNAGLVLAGRSRIEDPQALPRHPAHRADRRELRRARTPSACKLGRGDARLRHRGRLPPRRMRRRCTRSTDPSASSCCDSVSAHSFTVGAGCPARRRSTRSASCPDLFRQPKERGGTIATETPVLGLWPTDGGVVIETQAGMRRGLARDRCVQHRHEVPAADGRRVDAVARPDAREADADRARLPHRPRPSIGARSTGVRRSDGTSLLGGCRRRRIRRTRRPPMLS